MSSQASYYPNGGGTRDYYPAYPPQGPPRPPPNPLLPQFQGGGGRDRFPSSDVGGMRMDRGQYYGDRGSTLSRAKDNRSMISGSTITESIVRPRRASRAASDLDSIITPSDSASNISRRTGPRRGYDEDSMTSYTDSTAGSRTRPSKPTRGYDERSMMSYGGSRVTGGPPRSLARYEPDRGRSQLALPPPPPPPPPMSQMSRRDLVPYEGPPPPPPPRRRSSSMVSSRHGERALAATDPAFAGFCAIMDRLPDRRQQHGPPQHGPPGAQGPPNGWAGNAPGPTIISNNIVIGGGRKRSRSHRR
ncbi:hypothetical protein F5Y04DRAFT_278053 [Hypomontagnella monticulosa]|nr:hypothetical protein F5Y04DRAFT_278053 [Hypomontagnella monticulosa]